MFRWQDISLALRTFRSCKNPLDAVMTLRGIRRDKPLRFRNGSYLNPKLFPRATVGQAIGLVDAQNAHILQDKSGNLQGIRLAGNTLITWPEAVGVPALGIIHAIYVRNEYGKHSAAQLAGKCVVDVGAFVGDTAVLFAKQGAFVYAIEPNKVYFRYLVENIRANRCQDQVRPLNCAVDQGSILVSGDTAPSEAWHTPLARAPNNVGVASLSMSQVISLAVDEGHSEVEVVKLDCEGCEGSAFEECSWLDHVNQLYLEIHRKVVSYDLILTKLIEKGFRVSTRREFSSRDTITISATRERPD